MRDIVRNKCEMYLLERISQIIPPNFHQTQNHYATERSGSVAILTEVKLLKI